MLAALDLVEKEEAADNVLATYNAQLVQAINTLQSEKMIKTVEHPDVRRADDQVKRMQALVLQRRTEISSIIRQRIDNRFQLMDQKTVAEAKEAVEKAQSMLKFYTTQLAALDEKAKKLVYVKGQISALDDQIMLVAKEFDTSYTALQDMKKLDTTITNNSGIKIAEYADPPVEPSQDKRVKVQAAGMVGGLFLGMLLALLVDK